MKKIFQIILSILLSHAINAQNDIEQKMSELLNLSKAPGMNFSIIDANGDQQNYSAGYADVEKKEKMTPGHAMFSGSIGKTYAIAVIAQLVDEGKIDLDKKFIEYFPDVAWLHNLPNINEFSILELMQHRSGLPRYAFKEGVWETVKNEPDKVWTYKDRLSYIFGDSAVHPAGKGFAYSDTGYLLLGMLIEKMTGQYLYDAIQERLIDSLELKETYAADKRAFPNSANTYSRDEVFQMPGPVFVNGVCRFNPQMENAGGGFVNTASDLAKWAKLYYEGASFSDNMKTVIQTISPNGANVYEGWNCGAGIFILETKYGLAYGHTGLMVGTRSVMLFFPDYNLSAAMQMNTDKPEGELGLLESLELLIDVAAIE
jgi:D-alanyl-D-alanine carboxypeptidase